MKESKQKIITICASASHYAFLEKLQSDLKQLGFKVIIPKTAKKMIKTGDFNVAKHKVWYKDKKLFNIKTKLIWAHFKKVEIADIVLFANYEKGGIKGYIGGNALMEMTLAFYLKKPIYVLNEIPKELSIYEEVHGIKPIFLNGNINLIKK